jgi:hypothetical protein
MRPLLGPRRPFLSIGPQFAVLAVLLMVTAGQLPPNPLRAVAESTAGPTVLSFAPTDDAYITPASPTTNFGSATSLRADDSPVEQFLVKFEVSGIGTGKVTSAKLRLFCANGSSIGGDFHRLADPDAPWNEDTVTWNNAPGVAAGTVASLGPVVSGAWYEVDVTSIVTADGSVSLRVTSPSSDGAHYRSKEEGSGFAPRLVVVADTPPTAPTNVAATAVNPNQIDLTWSASIDDIGVTGYEIFRDGSLLATTGAVTSFSDTTVAPATTYEYQLRARDASGNLSAFGNPAAATTPGTGTTTHTFLSLADGYASSIEPDRNFGTLSALRTDGSPDVRSFLRFDPDGLGTPISAAILRVFANSANSDGIDVRGVTTNAWGETTLTYGNMPGVLPVTESSGPFTTGTWVEWSITSLVSGNDPISFALTSTSVTATSLASRESANPPQLIVMVGSAASPGPSPSPTASPSPAPSPSPSPSPVPGTDPVIAAAGDIACDPGSAVFNGGAGTATACRHRYTSDLLAGVDAVLTLGDIQYEDATLAKFRQSYDPTWGRFKGITRPSAGNHEYLTPGASGYFDYFGAAAGARSEGWYSFDIGKWHLIALNSNCSKVGGCGPGSPQYEWLRADLAQSTAMCTAAYWHHPRFADGQYADNSAYQPFWQLLYNDGAEVVLNGHDHNYQRYAPMTPTGTRDDAKGIRQFIVGTGGKSHYAVDKRGANREAANAGTFGVVRLTLRANGYTWRFTPEAGKTFTYSGTGSCH